MSILQAQIKHLRNLIQIGTDEQIITAMEKIHSSDISYLFTELTDVQIKRLVDCLFLIKKAAPVIKEIPEFMLPDVIEMVDPDKLTGLIARLDIDDAAYVMGKIPVARWQEIFSKLPVHQKNQLEIQLLYPKHSAASVMNPEAFSVQVGTNVGEAIASLRQFAARESVFYVYVVDHKRLVGVIPVRSLVLNDLEKPLRDIMTTSVLTIQANDDQEKAAKMVSQYNLLALPVVNDNQELLGVITVDDVIDIFEEEMTEDIQKLGGMEALDQPYLMTTFKQLIKKRAGWLSALFIGEMLTATAMGYFEGQIARAVVLALFVPLIISSGGNSGSQASTLVIRALALGDVKLKQWWRVIKRELLMGLVLGSILGTIGFIRIILWQGIFHPYGEHYILIAATVFFSLIGVVSFGTLAGSGLPFLLRRLGFDPASASAPFVATLVDVTGLIIYFTVAGVLLHGTLL